ncbi:MAG: metal-dependent hydrolase [Halobacteriaceae archaeon]
MVYGVPILLGALFPDVDTVFGTHRATFHNAATLGLAVAFPLAFDNLHYVWIGVLTHYVLDLLGNVRGMAVLYPYPSFYDVPVGVPVNSHWADVVTLAVTVFEVGVLYALVRALPLLPALSPVGRLVGV